MSSKVKISVEEGASHGVRATLVSTTTGQEYAGETIDAGKDFTFTVEDEQRIDISRGAPTPEAEAKAPSTAKKK